jgi:hypothetical protein
MRDFTVGQIRDMLPSSPFDSIRDNISSRRRQRGAQDMARACMALIGGGRWGRVHASVLARISSPIDRTLWVTRHNKSALDAFLAQRADATAPRFKACASLDAALAERPTAAIVVNAGAALHARGHPASAPRPTRKLGLLCRFCDVKIEPD